MDDSAGLRHLGGMLLVKARAQPSSLHGIGLFALEAIPKGTPFWRFEPGFDRAFTREQFAALPEPAQAHLRHYAYLDAPTDRWILNGDLTIFMNHSSSPNTGALPDMKEPIVTVTLRDIAAREELTCDYFAFDGAAEIKLGKKQ